MGKYFWQCGVFQIIQQLLVLHRASYSALPPLSILNDITWVDTAGKALSPCIREGCSPDLHHQLHPQATFPHHCLSCGDISIHHGPGGGATCLSHQSLLSVSQGRRGWLLTDLKQRSGSKVLKFKFYWIDQITWSKEILVNFVENLVYFTKCLTDTAWWILKYLCYLNLWQLHLIS